MIKEALSRFRWGYIRFLRPHFPRKIVELNGVPVWSLALPDRTRNREDYEEDIASKYRDMVEEGDRVVIVGGGYGVTAIIAARQGAHVTCYEGSAERAELIRKNVQMNAVAERVDVYEAIVGQKVMVVGDGTEATKVEPSDLPACDFLELDCEGSELSILKELTIRPEVIIVETHECFDVPVDAVREILVEKGYEIVLEEETDSKNGIHTITAEL